MARDNSLLFAIVGLTVGAAILELYLSRQTDNSYADVLPPPERNPYDIYNEPPTVPMSATTSFTDIFQSIGNLFMTSPAGMKTSQAGLNNIARWEGRRNAAYQDMSGNWTIGIGHKIVSGDGLTPQTVLTDATVDALFMDDIDDAENIVRSTVGVALTQGQFDALVDFAFQFGSQLNTSTLLMKLNAGDYAGAAQELSRWVHAHTPTGQLVTVPQLVDRRNADISMFG